MGNIEPFAYAIYMSNSNIRKFRWSKDYESAEEELIALLEWRNIEHIRVIDKEYEEYAITSKDEHVRLWCAEGSFTLSIKDSSISMQPGDAVDILPQSECTLLSGIAGCVYYRTTGEKITRN